ncbi:MAG: putative fatty-acid--CoA ligase [Ilumatobacteraceae bacterium]|nr:putative fatty-acid--CoA ligase [Ilumatobacteraceae bacterium]
MIVKQGRSPSIMPYDMSGIVRTDDGILRYSGLPTSLLEMLSSSVARTPDRECIVVLGGERVTYQDVWDRSARVAGGLAAAGVKPGDRVANRYGNSLDWCLAFWGTLMAGAVVVPVNSRFSDAEVDYVVTDSGAGYVFQPDAALPDGEPLVTAGIQQTDLAAIFYTSGTTGFPKGAMTTHENFLSNSETCRRIMFLPPDTHLRNLVSVPLFHVTGCNSQLIITTQLCGTTFIMPAFDVQTFLRATVDEQINILTSVPAIFWLAMSQPNFNEFDVSNVRWVTYGGAPTAPDVIARLRASFPNARLGNGFGLTETSSVSTFLPDEYAELRPETVGFTAPPVEVDLLEPDPETGVGELLIRGQNVVAGYWNKPQQTEETFVDGWLHTGDLARVDDEGFVQIVDRKKDMVNRGGENVYCVEVENALVEHPAVFEVAVLGVPDAMMGEKVGAVIVTRPGMTADPAEIRAFAKARIADFKVPQFISFRPEPLPRNAGGKVLKPVLRKETEWGDQLR